MSIAFIPAFDKYIILIQMDYIFQKSMQEACQDEIVQLWCACIDCIKKLNGVNRFHYKIGYTTEFNGDMGCNKTGILPVLSSWEFIGSSLWKGIGKISADFTLKLLTDPYLVHILE